MLSSCEDGSANGLRPVFQMGPRAVSGLHRGYQTQSYALMFSIDASQSSMVSNNGGNCNFHLVLATYEGGTFTQIGRNGVESKRGDLSGHWTIRCEGNVRAAVMDSCTVWWFVLRNFEFRPSDLTGLFENFDWLIIRALFFIVDLRLCVTRYEGRFTSIIIIFT